MRRSPGAALQKVDRDAFRRGRPRVLQRLRGELDSAIAPLLARAREPAPPATGWRQIINNSLTNCRQIINNSLANALTNH